MRGESEYKSKVDWWIGAVLLLVLGMGIVSLPVGIWYLTMDRVGEGWTFLSMASLMLGVFGLLIWPVRYTLTADTLIIRYGVVRSRLKLETITGVEPSHNPLSAPALSLDRLKITHTGKMGLGLISPVDQGRFMQDLADRCDHLIYADGKVRATDK